MSRGRGDGDGTRAHKASTIYNTVQYCTILTTLYQPASRCRRGRPLNLLFFRGPSFSVVFPIASLSLCFVPLLSCSFVCPRLFLPPSLPPSLLLDATPDFSPFLPAGLFQPLDDFLRTSTVGEFFARLQMLRAFAAQLLESSSVSAATGTNSSTARAGGARALATVLLGLWQYYSQVGFCGCAFVCWKDISWNFSAGARRECSFWSSSSV